MALHLQISACIENGNGATLVMDVAEVKYLKLQWNMVTYKQNAYLSHKLTIVTVNRNRCTK